MCVEVAHDTSTQLTCAGTGWSPTSGQQHQPYWSAGRQSGRHRNSTQVVASCLWCGVVLGVWALRRHIYAQDGGMAHLTWDDP
jgi:hypothetical protein